MKLRVAFLLLVLTFIGCREEQAPAIVDLPPTPFLTSPSQWGLVNKAYVRIFRESDENGEVEGVLRSGDLVEVISTLTTHQPSAYWMEIRFNDIVGWVLAVNLDLYESEAQARTASQGVEAVP